MRRAPLIFAVLLLGLVGPGYAATREVLPNGLRVLIDPNPATDVMSAELLLSIPASAEPEEMQGLRYLTQRMLLRGTTLETGDAMGEKLAAVGGSVSVTAALDYVEVTVQAPADGFEVALQLLAEAVQHPALRAEEVEEEKGKVLSGLQAAQEDPFQCTYQALRRELYGHAPYGRWVLGEPRTVSRLTQRNVIEFYRTHYGPEVAVLAIAGGVDAARAHRAVREGFGGWGRLGASGPPALVTEPPLTSSEVTVRELPEHQLYVMIGFPAPAVNERRYFALQVIDSLLSGGSTARLPKALRDEKGLVYQVSSFYPTLAGASHFGIFAVTDDGGLAEVKQAILQQLTRLREEPVPAEELVRAKRYLLGTFAMSRQQSQVQAYSAAWYEVLGLPPTFPDDYRQGVSAVTAQEVQETAQDLIHHFILALTVPSV